MIEIFEQEKKDDLEDLISATACISYASQAEPCVATSKIQAFKSLASYNDSDLYYVQSILVSSSWNKNDDIFDKAEVWKAKNTPEDKPTNLEHDENLIIGHITSNWPITEDGILIDTETPIDNLPEKYHILTGSVIYKGFSNPELRDRSSKLIAEIEDGIKFVSMECFFNGFDYGLIDEASGDFKVLPRNHETAYLTKYLRSYGGQGYHESYKIGRVLRNITFSGKGFVNKPANPDSIIFNKTNFDKILIQKNDTLSKPGVSKNTLTSNAENNIMSLDIEVVQKEIAELKTKIESLKDCGCAEVTKEAYAAASALKDKNIELENTIQAQELSIAEKQTALEALLVEKEEAAKKMEEEKKMMEEEKKKVMSELESANEVIAVYKMKEEEMAKKEKKMKRMASLLEAGIDNEVAISTTDKFESLNDEAFDAMTSLLSLAAKKMTEKKTEKEEALKDKLMSEETVDASDLEDVEITDEISLSVGGDSENSMDSTRAELVEFVCARLGKKLNKGE
jgi:hypothetical protein